MGKILIADDHAIFRAGLKQVIATLEETTITDEAETGQEALRKVQANHYDLVILDISLPDRSGLEVLAEIKKMRRSLPVLIMSLHSEAPFERRALRAGAAGYLIKGSPCRELLAALREAGRGEPCGGAPLAGSFRSAASQGSDQSALGVIRAIHDLLPTCDRRTWTRWILDTMDWQAREYRERTGIDCTLEILLQREDFDSEVCTEIFRIFREALTDKRRHSEATRVVFTLHEKSNRLVLSAADHAGDNISGPGANPLTTQSWECGSVPTSWAE
jgi:DNA-binding NarL/FixJ family response regulator